MFRIRFLPQVDPNAPSPSSVLQRRPDPTDHLVYVFNQLQSYWGVLGPESLSIWKGFEEHVFDSENDGRWAPLRKRTVRERSWIQANTPMDLVGGFTSSHPILQRAGTLKRSITDWNFHSTRVTDYHEIGPEWHDTGAMIVWDSDLGKSDFSLHWATLDDRFLTLHNGQGFIPARPMVPDARSGLNAPDPTPLFKELEDWWVGRFEDFLNA